MSADDARRAFFTQCVKALARREYSRAELRAKAPPILGSDTVEAVLDELNARGWQSDVRFVQNYVRSKAVAGDGAQKIRHALKQRGIAAELVSAALAEEDWYAHAAALYRRKYRRPPADAQERLKRQRFMAQRGFSFDEIRAAESAFSLSD